ncbi:MAG TPA: NusG domain II-containing protein [Spirochaetota bacterium]|nr:NusG domain II-containing protein [Spirochaetota bacterium]
MPPVRANLTPADLLIVLVPLALAVFLFFRETGDGPSAVRITTPQGVWRYTLPAAMGLRFEGSAGEFLVEIKGGQVSIRETHCPDRLCQEMGPLEKSGAVMICVPQKIEVRLEGGDPEVDAVCR